MKIRQNVKNILKLGNVGDYEIGKSSTNQEQPMQTTRTVMGAAVNQEKDLLLNDFVIIKFRTNKRDKFYVWNF